MAPLFLFDAFCRQVLPSKQTSSPFRRPPFPLWHLCSLCGESSHRRDRQVPQRKRRTRLTRLLQSLQECDQVCLLLVCKIQGKSRVVEIHDVHQGGCRSVHNLLICPATPVCEGARIHRPAWRNAQQPLARGGRSRYLRLFRARCRGATDVDPRRAISVETGTENPGVARSRA